MEGSKSMNLTCEGCNGKCCRYVATEIDPPKDKESYEEIIWFLLHENIEVFIENKEWYIQFTTPCKKLDKKWRCSIYEKRPQICRDLKIDECEHHGESIAEDVVFKKPEDFIEYMKKKGIDIDFKE
ncbi:MAG: YkgJ family cysteine cluster protein [Candidatus Pacearchaeota archaeon]